jgi:phosphatidylserine/phosphatidylglycerophosphate/cardiolipin synthase-like enzyme
MKERLATFTLAMLIAASFGLFVQSQTLPPKYEVHFSPSGGCQAAVIKALDGAKVSVRLQGYSFTNKPIAMALVAAKRRGVDVQLILDKSNPKESASEAQLCSTGGIPVFIDAKHPIAHNKIVIIDGKIVLTGSFNFSHQAETENAENMLTIYDADLAKLYTANWEKHLAHSDPWKKP